MPNPDAFVAYHRPISNELEATKNRVKSLIGNAHPGEEGGYKESVLRNLLRRYLPESYIVADGFIIYQDAISTQQDILILQKDKPSLFQDEGFRIVTPDCVRAIIEVKTNLRTEQGIRDAIAKISTEAERIREAQNSFTACWAGLFVFDERNPNDRSGWSQRLLHALFDATNEEIFRVVNCVSIGPALFSRYWKTHPYQDVDAEYNSWHSYIFERDYEGFAQTYFIGNLLMGVTGDYSEHNRYAWFPIPRPLGKENYGVHQIRLNNRQMHPLNQR